MRKKNKSIKRRNRTSKKSRRLSRRRNPDDQLQKTLRQINEGDYMAIPKLFHEALKLGLIPRDSLRHHTITVEKRHDDYHVHCDDTRGKWAAGKSIKEAIGDLIWSHYDHYGIKIELPKKRRRS